MKAKTEPPLVEDLAIGITCFDSGESSSPHDYFSRNILGIVPAEGFDFGCRVRHNSYRYVEEPNSQWSRSRVHLAVGSEPLDLRLRLDERRNTNRIRTNRQYLRRSPVWKIEEM
jgi:hypothetical protein